MKTTVCFFILCLCVSTAFSQNEMKTTILATPCPLSGWQETPDWLAAVHAAFGEQIDTQWIGWLAQQGRFYQNPTTDGFYIILPDYMYSSAKLHAKLDYGIYESGDTRLMPVKSDEARFGNSWYGRFIGSLGGVPATLDLAVFDQNGKYCTVMGFYPGNELVNEFSMKFRIEADRLLNNQAFVFR